MYAFLMGAVSLILIVESIRDIGSHKAGDKNDLHIPSLVAVGVAFCTKVLLAIYCFGLRKYSSQVQVLYEDHRNDLGINGSVHLFDQQHALVLTNFFTTAFSFGIFTSAAGAKIAWWIDPLGAILISVVILFSWSRTAYLQFRELAGVAAPPEFLQLVTYNAMLHHADIEKIDSCKAYHSGPKVRNNDVPRGGTKLIFFLSSQYVVEVDIVMKPETPLWLSHDVSQALQDEVERLPMVERAFIHVDHEVDHRPEHRKVM